MDTIEDDFTWVIRKALKGVDVAPCIAAGRAGLPEGEVMAFARGKFSAETARRLAPVLGLHPEALANHDHYHPHPLAIAGVKRLTLPFNGETVNAWLIDSGDATVLFDTGHAPASCAQALGAILPERIFITHGHHDHIGGIPDFTRKGIPIHGPGMDAATSAVAPGDTFRCGSLVIKACDLSGHCTPSAGYLIQGLAQPILVTGDALFAGSIGGCATPELYRYALLRLSEVLAPLSDDTILLPGHGPATTLGEERRRNPFIAS